MELNWEHGVAWIPGLETGYADIDDQHKRLFKLMSDLIGSFQAGEKVAVDEALAFLVNYTLEHFSDEENIAQAYAYPGSGNHRKMHDDFTRTVRGFVRQYEKNGNAEELLAAVTKVVIKWVIGHIRNEDIKIAMHIKKLN